MAEKAKKRDRVPKRLIDTFTSDELIAALKGRCTVLLLALVRPLPGNELHEEFYDKGPCTMLRALHGRNEARVVAQEQTQNKLLCKHFEDRADGHVTIEGDDAQAIG
jgi:hypothetical protein